MRGNDDHTRNRRGSSPANTDSGPEFDNWGVDWMESRRLSFEEDATTGTSTHGAAQDPNPSAPAGEDTRPGANPGNGVG